MIGYSAYDISCTCGLEEGRRLVEEEELEGQYESRWKGSSGLFMSFELGLQSCTAFFEIFH